MNRKTTFGLLLSVVAVGATIYPSLLGATLDESPMTFDGLFLERVEKPSVRHDGPMRLIAKDSFFYEDFESMTPGTLDSGWTTVSTPGHPTDCWSVATLGTENKGMAGISGYQYAYILGNRNPSDTYGHDAWLFSPAVRLDADRECEIEFYTYMAAGYNVHEKLEVAVMSAANPDAVVARLDVIEDGTGQWMRNIYNWTPETEGEYYIGFHSLSPYMSNATLIDDVRVSCGPRASFLGLEGVDFGDTDLIAGTFKATYVIQNKGDMEMDIDVISTSPEVKVLKVPTTVLPYDFQKITIEFTPVKAGPYVGHFTLSTTDPSHPEVRLLVISNVRDVPVTGYHVEDFEAGGPKGWSMNFGAVNTDYMGGHKGPRSFYVRSFYTLDEEEEVGFTTHYYNMGPNPELSLWYKLLDCDLMGVVSGPTGSDSAILELYVLDNTDQKWTQVYTMKPGTETAHKASNSFTEIKVDLAKFANKCCRVKAVLKHAGNPLTDDFILLIDDVAAGTRPEVDLKTTALSGTTNVTVGNEYTVSGTVTNYGSAASGACTVELTDADGKVYASKELATVRGGFSSQFSLTWKPETSGNIDLKATVISANDANNDNNTSNLLHVSATEASNSYIEVGTGQMYLSNINPIDFCAKESLVQNVYYANELGIDAGEINSITFFSVFSNPYLSEDFEVYITETDRYDFNDKELIPESNFVKVFAGNIYMPANQYEFTIPFDNPYQYNGGNIVVMTRKCSWEFINTKHFIVNMDEVMRSIVTSTTNPGTLAYDGYENREASNDYAHIAFNMYKAPNGSVSGTVRDIEGAVLDDVKICLDGTQLFTTSNASGIYSLPEVKAGARTLTATKYGYYPSANNKAAVSDGGSTTVDITMTAYPRVTIRGTVRTAEGTPVPDAKVVLDGYAAYSVVTDADGNYEIRDVYGDTGEAYDLRAESLHFRTFWNHNYQVLKTDMTYDIVLQADEQPVFAVTATADGDNLDLAWEAPLVEFSHDNGTPSQLLGWSHGHARCAIFSTYRQKMLVKKIRFYLSSINGIHNDINVFLVGLNDEGYPDANDMRYLAKSVPFTDNAWTTVVLEKPVEIENFAIGISGTGNIGLGASVSDADHPFEPLMHFFAGDDMYNPYDLMDFAIWTPIHPMLRVYGDYLGDPATDPLHESLTGRRGIRPTNSYEIYRIDDVDNPESMKYLGSTRELTYSDDTYKNIEDGKYCRYAVVAKYGKSETEPVLSNIVKKTSSAVDYVETDMVSFGPNPIVDHLAVSRPELVREVRFYSLDGRCIKVINAVSERNDVSELQDGVYVVALTCNDGSLVTRKMIKK